MQKTKLFVAATFTLFVFPLLALGVSAISDNFSYYEMFPEQISLVNLLGGLILGAVISVLGVGLLRLDFFQNLTHTYQQLFSGLEINNVDIIFYSICAGVGEEIFFRGMLQDFIGIWPTAVLFVFLHGYLSVKSKPKLIYGVCLVLFSVGFGYLDFYLDIYAAIIAHIIYDIVMFRLLLNSK